jgi:trigger factor
MAKNKKSKVEEKNDISKSKAKRVERKKEVAKERRHKRTSQITGIVVVVAIVAVIAFFAGKNIYLAAIRTTSSSDMSAGLTTDGKIDGVDVSSVLTLVDYKNIDIPADEVAATDDEVDEDINSTLAEYESLSTDSSLEIADGDEVNIDYVGTIDGEEFDGGNSDGEGYNLTIGSGSFVDDFEEQLIGYHPGDEVTVEVTFPDDYSDDSVAGKDAVFAVTVNGINVTPELTDEFVAENLATDDITTADEYRASIEQKYYEEHLEDYITNYIVENSTVKSYPKAYLKAMKAITKYNDEYMLSYYNQMFSSYGMTAYENLWDLRDDDIDDELSYERELKTRAQESVKEALVYQGIFEDAGLTIDMDSAIAEMTEENGEDYVTNMQETYGEGYMAQDEMRDAVVDYLMELYK